MKKIIKITSITIGIIIVLLIISPFIAALVIDPNDYKDKISELVKEQTGRTLTIKGDINFSIFPWLGLSLGELQLSNSASPGFSKEAFAKIKSADVRIKLMPLFSKKLEVDKIVLAGLNLNLEKNLQGVANWQDLIEKSQQNTNLKSKKTNNKKSKPVSNNSAMDSDIILPAIAGIELINANINWHDIQLDQNYQLQNLNFTTGIIADKTPTNINISFSVKSNQPKLNAKTKLIAQLQFNIKQKSIKLSNLEITQNMDQKIQAPEKIEMIITAKAIQANLTTQTASISNLKLSSLDIDLQVSLTAKNILKNLTAKGSLSTNQINPKKLLSILQINLPKMADDSVLQKAKLDINFDASLNSEKTNLNKINLSKLDIKFDDSKLSGNLSLSNFTKPQLRYKLHFDEINLDRYLPPPVKTVNTTKSSKSPTVVEAPEQNLLIPVDLLRTLDIKGSFTLAKVTMVKLKSTDIKLTIRAKDGHIRLFPLQAKMYQGQYSGDIRMNVQKKIPLISLNEKMTGISFKPLVVDYMGEDYISGHGSVSAKLTTKGIKISEFTKNLNGSVSFNIRDSKIKYLNPEYLAKKGIFKYLKKDFKEKEEDNFDNPDVFKIMKGSFQIKNGIAHNNDFITESRDLNLDGKGYVDIIKRFVKYDARIIFQKDLKVGDNFIDRQLKPLTKHPVPFPISGPFDNIQYNEWAILEELTKLHEQKAKKDLQNKADAEKKKLEQDAQKKIDFEKKKLEDKLKKELEKLFK